jgi:hypothetical protein
LLQSLSEIVMSRTFSHRRNWLCATGLALTAGYSTFATERPPVTVPRATSGDAASEPDWEERLTITVGPKEADIVGATNRALQAAVDYVARLGGGTVKVLPGEYRLRNSVFLASKVRIVGSGEDSVLIKEPSATVKLSADSDWYDQEITLAEDAGFRIGDGVCLRTKNPHNGGQEVLKRTLVARSGKRFKLDRALRQNFWQLGESTASSLFPILSGEEIGDFAIENIVLDGNRAKNANLDGNYAGCIFLQDCNRGTIRGVTARHYNGDGISWQICHDMQVTDCHSHGHAGLGLHPGSGSQRPVMKGNRLEDNDIGIFFCWGVKYGLAEGNKIRNCRLGVSIGHRDTDNLVADNDIADSGQSGVLFRPERGAGFCGHRNRIEKNRITNSGGEAGIGIDVQGGTESITLQSNEIRELREPMNRTGIRLGKETKQITLAENKIEGVKVSVDDQRAVR